MLSVSIRSVLSLVAVLAYTQLSHAQDYQIGTAEIDGSGCPAGSASVAVSPDNRTISVLFDKLSVSAPTGSQGGTVKCNLRIHVNSITAGYVLDTTTFDFRGFAQLPQNTVAVLTTRGGAEGAGRLNVVQEQISNSGDFEITRVANQSNVHHCHSKANDLIKLDIGLSLSPHDVLSSDGMITVDTADLGTNSGLQLGVALRKCDEAAGPGNGNGHGNGNGNGHGNGHGHGNQN